MSGHLFVTSTHLLLLMLFRGFVIGWSASPSSASLSASAVDRGVGGPAVSTSVSGGGSLNAAAVAAGNGGASDVGGGRGFGEYCTSEWFNASCADVAVPPPLQPPQQYQQQRHLQGNVAADDSLSVVVMTTAFYGRMRSGRCVQMKYGQPGCRADVLGQLDDECSGRPTCQFPVSRLLANGVTPCDGELMSYLEAAYICVRVSRGACSHNERHKILTAQTGYIPLNPPSSAVAPPYGAGSQRCPWRIVVDPLQRVRIILYAFGSRHHGQQSRQDDGQGGQGQGQGRGLATPSCPAFAVFDGAAERSLCQLNGARQMVLHTSESHQVTVHFRFSPTTSDKQLSPTSFMLYYEAFGCPTLKVPTPDGSSGAGAWVMQQDTGKAVVKCNKTDETWYLQCDGRQWKGHFGNCTTLAPAATPNDAEPRTSPTANSLSFGLIMAVVIGVLLGVVIGAVPLGLAYVCLKRKWRQTPPDGYVHGGNDDDPYDPVSAGKASLMTSVRGATSGTGVHHQHQHQQQFTGTSSPHHLIHAGAPPAYGVNMGGMVGPRGIYPSFQQYCSGDMHHHHSPNCYGTIDSGDVDQAMTGLTLTVADGVDCGLHGGCRRLEHVYESASFAGGRNAGVRHLGPRMVGLVDEQFMTPGTVIGVGCGNSSSVGGDMTATTTVVCPLHFDVVGGDGGKTVA